MQLIRFAVTQRGKSAIRAVRGKIKNKHVVLVVLQRRNQCQQFAAAGFISVTQNDRGSAAHPREEPSFSLAQAGYLKIHDLRMARKTGQADFTAAALRLDNSVDQKPGDGRRRQHGKKGQRQNKHE